MLPQIFAFSRIMSAPAEDDGNAEVKNVSLLRYFSALLCGSARINEANFRGLADEALVFKICA